MAISPVTWRNKSHPNQRPNKGHNMAGSYRAQRSGYSPHRGVVETHTIQWLWATIWRNKTVPNNTEVIISPAARPYKKRAQRGSYLPYHGEIKTRMTGWPSAQHPDGIKPYIIAQRLRYLRVERPAASWLSVITWRNKIAHHPVVLFHNMVRPHLSVTTA